MIDSMNLTLVVWRQASSEEEGYFKDYKIDNIDGDMSFLEMIDVLNEKLILENDDPITFDHDCREGICGACSMYINGKPHGPQKGTTTCQLHMRHFNNGDRIVIEPWRAKGFPIIKDLMVDRTSFDRIIQAGGYISVNTGNAPDGNAIPINKSDADEAFTSAECIGCGACVAACKNASAMLFVGAKVNQLSLLPQGKPERSSRVKQMIFQMEEEGFGHCTNTGACEAECPKEISLDNISKLNREYLKSIVKE